jgi:hypothetical protein
MRNIQAENRHNGYTGNQAGRSVESSDRSTVIELNFDCAIPDRQSLLLGPSGKLKSRAAVGGRTTRQRRNLVSGPHG